NMSADRDDKGSMTGLPLTTTDDGRTGARDLVVQLNSGALPVQLSVLQEQNVDAALRGDAGGRGAGRRGCGGALGARRRDWPAPRDSVHDLVLPRAGVARLDGARRIH